MFLHSLKETALKYEQIENQELKELHTCAFPICTEFIVSVCDLSSVSSDQSNIP